MSITHPPQPETPRKHPFLEALYAHFPKTWRDSLEIADIAELNYPVEIQSLPFLDAIVGYLDLVEADFLAKFDQISPEAMRMLQSNLYYFIDLHFDKTEKHARQSLDISSVFIGRLRKSYAEGEITLKVGSRSFIDDYVNKKVFNKKASSDIKFISQNWRGIQQERMQMDDLSVPTQLRNFHDMGSRYVSVMNAHVFSSDKMVRTFRDKHVELAKYAANIDFKTLLAIQARHFALFDPQYLIKFYEFLGLDLTKVHPPKKQLPETRSIGTSGTIINQIPPQSSDSTEEPATRCLSLSEAPLPEPSSFYQPLATSAKARRLMAQVLRYVKAPSQAPFENQTLEQPSLPVFDLQSIHTRYLEKFDQANTKEGMILDGYEKAFYQFAEPFLNSIGELDSYFFAPVAKAWSEMLESGYLINITNDKTASQLWSLESPVKETTLIPGFAAEELLAVQYFWALAEAAVKLGYAPAKTQAEKDSYPILATLYFFEKISTGQIKLLTNALFVSLNSTKRKKERWIEIAVDACYVRDSLGTDPTTYDIFFGKEMAISPEERNFFYILMMYQGCLGLSHPDADKIKPNPGMSLDEINKIMLNASSGDVPDLLTYSFENINFNKFHAQTKMLQKILEERQLRSP